MYPKTLSCYTGANPAASHLTGKPGLCRTTSHYCSGSGVLNNSSFLKSQLPLQDKRGRAALKEKTLVNNIDLDHRQLRLKLNTDNPLCRKLIKKIKVQMNRAKFHIYELRSSWFFKIWLIWVFSWFMCLIIKCLDLLKWSGQTSVSVSIITSQNLHTGSLNRDVVALNTAEVKAVLGEDQDV